MGTSALVLLIIVAVATLGTCDDSAHIRGTAAPMTTTPHVSPTTQPPTTQPPTQHQPTTTTTTTTTTTKPTTTASAAPTVTATATQAANSTITNTTSAPSTEPTSSPHSPHTSEAGKSYSTAFPLTTSASSVAEEELLAATGPCDPRVSKNLGAYKTCETYSIIVAVVYMCIFVVAVIQLVRLRASGLPRWIPEPSLHITIAVFAACRATRFLIVFFDTKIDPESFAIRALLQVPTVILFTAYSLILWHWVRTYHSTASEGAMDSKWIGIAFVFVNLLLYAFTFVLVQIATAAVHQPWVRVLYDCLFLTIVFGMAVAICYYGTAVTRSLKSYSRVSEAGLRTFRRLSCLTFLSTTALIVVVGVAVITLVALPKYPKPDIAVKVFLWRNGFFRLSETVLCFVFMFTARPFNRKTGEQTTTAYSRPRKGYDILATRDPYDGPSVHVQSQ